MKLRFTLLMLCVWSAAVAADLAAPAKRARVTIPGAWYFPHPDGQWHGSPPGYQKDWGWTQFAKVDDFVLREGGRPTQRTEVRLFYTPRSLYVAATLYDAEIHKLVRGVGPQEHPEDAPLEWLADVFEVFVQPDLSRPVYYQLGVNPRGARYDNAGGKGAPGGWDGQWRVGTKVYTDRWQVEMAIDISSLVLPGQFRGTPARGSQWGITFCRSAGHWKEYSSWATPNGWHRVGNFGRVVFGPHLATTSWKDHPLGPDDVIVTAVDPGRPDLGRRRLVATLTNPGTKPLNVDLELRVGDAKGWSLDPVAVTTTKAKQTVAAGKTERVAMAYTVTEGRGPTKCLTFTVRRPECNGPSYWADCRFTIYPLAKKVRAMRAVLDRVAAVCKQGASVPAAAQGAAQALALRKRLAEATRPGVSPVEAIPKARAVETDVQKLQLDFANRLRPKLHLRAAGVQRPGFAVGSVSATTKVLDDAPFDGPLGQPVRIALAKAEYESAQFVLLATDDALPEVRFRVGPLVGPGGATIAPAGVSTYRVGTVRVESSLPVRNGLWPDPLYPTDRTPAKVGVPQPVMVTVHTAREQAPGVYRGSVRFSAEGFDAVEMPLEVRVYDFALPERLSLFNEIWWDSVRPGAYYGRVTPALYEKFVRLCAAYRVVPGVDHSTIQRHLKFRKRPDGTIAHDWTDVDPYLRIMRTYGRPRQNINFYCSWQTWPAYFERSMWYPVPGRTQARHHICPDPMAAYGRFLKACFEHLVSLGWKPEDLYYAGADEPWAQQVRDDMRPAFELARRVLPTIRRSSAASHPGMANIADLIEIWCPQVREFTPGAYRGDGREVWMYTCGWKCPPYPCYSVPVPGMAARITGWVCRKYNVTGFLNWGTTVWELGSNIDVARAKPPGEKRWVQDGWRVATASGDGALVYPTPEGPIASQRLLCIRDGTEDYEYLTLLRRAAVEAKHAPKPLVDEALRLGAVPDTIVAATSRWTHDVSQIESARARAAELIVRLRKK